MRLLISNLRVQSCRRRNQNDSVGLMMLILCLFTLALSFPFPTQLLKFLLHWVFQTFPFPLIKVDKWKILSWQKVGKKGEMKIKRKSLQKSRNFEGSVERKFKIKEKVFYHWNLKHFSFVMKSTAPQGRSKTLFRILISNVDFIRSLFFKRNKT